MSLFVSKFTAPSSGGCQLDGYSTLRHAAFAGSNDNSAAAVSARILRTGAERADGERRAAPFTPRSAAQAGAQVVHGLSFGSPAGRGRDAAARHPPPCAPRCIIPSFNHALS